MNIAEQPISFESSQDGLRNIIKVIGVGGGGNNAVNHMCEEGIKGVDFVVLNTDKQVLEKSPVANKVLLGPNCCKGLGAGARPELAEQAAEESKAEIERILDSNTEMVFVTAGMGGGTGTGAAHVVARLAREKGILTIGIATLPFGFEGKNKMEKAVAGIIKLEKNCDATIIVNNQNLLETFPGFSFKSAFKIADDVLSKSAKGIADIITIPGHINLDFQDVRTTMLDGGYCLMNTGVSSGENRMTKALEDAVRTPLLKNNNILGAKKVLLNFYCSSNEEYMLKIDEINALNDFMEKQVGCSESVIWGIAFRDEIQDDEVQVTIIATGFKARQIDERMPFVQEDLQKGQTEEVDFQEKTIQPTIRFDEPIEKKEEIVPEMIDGVLKEEIERRVEEEYGETGYGKKQDFQKTDKLLNNVEESSALDTIETASAFSRRPNFVAVPYTPKEID
ncbi:MAG: cell division protein FtsZ [Paludibacteraceae bacterium]|nr:cell division protein FtsZ [Paludibacteraceae bacterium]